RCAEDPAAVLDVEDDGLSLLAADEQEAVLLVERDAPRARAAVVPGRDDLPGGEIDRVRLAAPLVRVGALPPGVDAAGLRSVVELDDPDAPGCRRAVLRQREDLDPLGAGLRPPDLGRGGDIADVVGPAGERRVGDDDGLRWVDDVQPPGAAVAREEQTVAL